MGCRSYGVVRGNYGVARDEERASTIEKAEKLVGKLEEEGFPTVIRPMLPSHVTGCFWLVISFHFTPNWLIRLLTNVVTCTQILV